MKRKDISGEKFGTLTALRIDKESNAKLTKWICVCECGKIVSVFQCNLLRGLTKSCGCRRWLGRHHKAGSKIYLLWNAMRQRCENPNDQAYKYYGGRGIGVCERWKVFDNFFEDMGINKKGMTIERINNDLGYYKENCRWASRLEQGQNTRSTKKIIANGLEKTYREWQERVGITREAIRGRLRRGWNPDSFLH